MAESNVVTPSGDSESRARVAALKALAILDTPPENTFNALVRVAASLCDMPIAIVSLLDGDRLWFKAATGLSADTIPSENSFCKHAATLKTLLSVPDARSDLRFADNELVAGELKIQAYIGAPIIHEGVAVGTVCALDLVPHEVTAKSAAALTELAVLNSALLTARIDAFRLLTHTDARLQSAPAES